LAKIVKKPEGKKEGEVINEIVLDEIDQRWEIHSLIGQGTYGAVYKAFDKKLNCMVALKKTKFLRIGEGMPGYALKEINILKQLNHPSVVRLLDVVNDGLKGEKLYLVFEHCNMDINHHLNS
jgi:serine/threonine protein kinase